MNRSQQGTAVALALSDCYTDELSAIESLVGTTVFFKLIFLLGGKSVEFPKIEEFTNGVESAAYALQVIEGTAVLPSDRGSEFDTKVLGCLQVLKKHSAFSANVSARQRDIIAKLNL